MKKIILALACLISVSAFAQENMVDVVMDGKPAKLNTATGVFTFTNGAPSSYTSNNNNNSTPFNTSNNKIHTVSKGETLYSISRQYQISMAQIKSLNNLSTNVLSVNQELQIGYNNSVQTNKASVYTVKKGDSLYRIAKNVNLSVSELKQLNNLEGNTISIGQVLKLK